MLSYKFFRLISNSFEFLHSAKVELSDAMCYTDHPDLLKKIKMMEKEIDAVYTKYQVEFKECL